MASAAEKTKLLQLQFGDTLYGLVPTAGTGPQSTGTNSSSVQLAQNPVYLVVTPVNAKQTSLFLRSDNTMSKHDCLAQVFCYPPVALLREPLMDFQF